MGENPARQHHVGALSGVVDEIAAQGLKQKIETDDRADADDQHPQRFDGLVWDHPVVHVHDEQGGGNGERVDQKGGDDNIGIGARELTQRSPKPRTRAFQCPFLFVAAETELGPHEDRVPLVNIEQVVDGNRLRSETGFRQDDLGFVSRQPADENASRAILQ